MLGRGYPGRSTNVLRLTSTVEAQFVGSYNDPQSITRSGVTANLTATITGMLDTTGILVGAVVKGPGVVAGQTVLSIDSASQVTISANATTAAGAGAGSFIFVQPTHNQVLVIDNVAGALKTSGTATTPPLIHISVSGQGTTFVKLGSLLASATVISAIASFNITPATGLRVLTATGIPSSTNVYAIVDGGGGAPANIDITIAYHWE